MLQAEPNNAALLYLAGRMRVRGAHAMAYMDRAIAADSTLVWPLQSKVAHLHARGRFSDALAVAIEAARRSERSVEAMQTLDSVRLALGDFESLERRIEAQREETPGDTDLCKWHLVVLAAQGHWSKAERISDEYIRAAGEEVVEASQADLRVEAALAMLREDYPRLRKLALKMTDDAVANEWLYKAALGAGDVDLATERATQLPATTWDDDLLLATEAAIQGKTELADQWRGVAREKLAQGTLAARAIAALLDEGGAVDVEAALDLNISVWEKTIVLVAIARQRADPRLLSLAEKLNYFPGFPRALLQRIIAALRAGVPQAGRWRARVGIDTLDTARRGDVVFSHCLGGAQMQSTG